MSLYINTGVSDVPCCCHYTQCPDATCIHMRVSGNPGVPYMGTGGEGGGGRSNRAFYTEVSYSETPIERLCLEEPLKLTALL